MLYNMRQSQADSCTYNSFGYVVPICGGRRTDALSQFCRLDMTQFFLLGGTEVVSLAIMGPSSNNNQFTPRGLDAFLAAVQTLEISFVVILNGSDIRPERNSEITSLSGWGILVRLVTVFFSLFLSSSEMRLSTENNSLNAKCRCSLPFLHRIGSRSKLLVGDKLSF